VSVSEEKAKHNKHSAMRNPLSLCVGRFVDAKEEESECKLCERVGFTSSSALPERSLILLVVTDF